MTSRLDFIHPFVHVWIHYTALSRGHRSLFRTLPGWLLMTALF